MFKKTKQGRTAILVVDVQNDFCEGGSLPVTGGGQLAINIYSTLEKVKSDIPTVLLVASQDWHNDSHISFASAYRHLDKTIEDFDVIYNELNPTLASETSISKKTVVWPNHCVKHTHGAKLTLPLEEIMFDYILKKGTNLGIDNYSAYTDGFADVLNEEGVTDLLICGIATDVCVYHTAKDFQLQWVKQDPSNRTVNLLKDLCVGVNEKDVETKLNILSSLGVAIEAADGEVYDPKS